MDYPDCYKCIYRHDLPGDAHSGCHHPLVEHMDRDPLGGLVDLLAGKASAAQELQIVGDPGGIRRGWFHWPVNFNPVWLRSCTGFTPRTKKKEQPIDNEVTSTSQHSE